MEWRAGAGFIVLTVAAAALATACGQGAAIPNPPATPGTSHVRAARPARYVVTAPVLYRTGRQAPRACLAILTSMPPAGCSGVPVTGYDFGRVPGLVRYGSAGWQTPLLRMAGTWNGRALALKHTPAPASAAPQPPAPPAACHGRPTLPAKRLMTRIGRAGEGIGLLELTPCGARVWVLVAVADHTTRAEIRDRFGNRVTVAGWLRR